MAVDLISMAVAAQSGTLVFDRANVLLTYPSSVDGSQVQTSIEEIAGILASFVADLQQRHNNMVKLLQWHGSFHTSPDGSCIYVDENNTASPMSYDT